METLEEFVEWLCERQGLSGDVARHWKQQRLEKICERICELGGDPDESSPIVEQVKEEYRQARWR